VTPSQIGRYGEFFPPYYGALASRSVTSVKKRRLPTQITKSALALICENIIDEGSRVSLIASEMLGCVLIAENANLHVSETQPLSHHG